MRMPIRSTTLAALLTVWTLGCGDAATDSASPLQFGADPIALDEQLVFVDATHRTAFLLDVSAAQPKAASQRIALPPNAAVAVRRSGSDHNEALVLCAGLRGTTDRDAEPSALVAIGPDATSHTYELGTTPFNALTQSDDGRYAIAYRSDQADKRTLDNPNELVVVDLDLQPDDPHAVTRKTPDGLAHTLSSVLVSPTLRIAGEDRRLLVVLSAAPRAPRHDRVARRDAADQSDSSGVQQGEPDLVRAGGELGQHLHVPLRGVRERRARQ
jgi:hypothetical protein